MAYKAELVENNTKLCILVDISPAALKGAIQSKSALAKAAKAGLEPGTVPMNLVASSGGFVVQGPVKFSLNVTKA